MGKSYERTLVGLVGDGALDQGISENLEARLLRPRKWPFAGEFTKETEKAGKKEVVTGPVRVAAPWNWAHGFEIGTTLMLAVIGPIAIHALVT